MAGVRDQGILLVEDIGGGGGGGGGNVDVVSPLGSQSAAASVSVAIASDQLPLPVAGSFSVTGGLTDTELRASPVPVSVSGTVTIAEPVTVDGAVTVSGSVTTGGLTDTQLRATPVPVSGTVTATGPLTDTQLRATPVPVSGTVSTGGLTDTQLRATPVPVSGTVSAIAAGDVAHGTTDAGNPVKIGGKAATSFPTAEATGERVNLLSDVYGRPLIRTASQSFAANAWTAIHVPATNVQATATKASAGAGIRNVCIGFTVTLAALATAPTAVQLVVNLIDGASGVTTYLWRSVISLPATAGAMSSIIRSNCWIPGTAATAMTMEFSATGGTNTIESVSMEGTIAAE